MGDIHNEKDYNSYIEIPYYNMEIYYYNIKTFERVFG